ncbi:MAG: hypothetical protein ABFQ82_03800 [Thermodesulfobacteriota bacterium]
MDSPIFNIVPNNPVLSIAILVLIVVIAATVIRRHAHKTIRGFCRVIRNGLRLLSFSFMKAEKRLAVRNREVLLVGGLDAVEREVEREFQRIETVVERDLQGYPALNRKLSEEIEKIDQSFSESEEVPPTPPVWVDAVEAVSKLASKGDSGMVTDILKDIHNTIVKQQKNAMDAYWKSTSERHAILGKMMPYWRSIAKTMKMVGSTMTGLEERAKFIDRKMNDYEEIRKGTDKAVATLHSSSMTQFFISSFWLLVAIGGIFVNFRLIELPMSDIVGGSGYVGDFKISELAALVVILLETFLGMALMEVLRVTKLFPMIGTLDDKKRYFIAWVVFGGLLTFAGVESSLAYIRDIIAARNEAFTQALLGGEAMAQMSHSVVATVAQMVMGFILPFVLAFAIIPLESFVHSARAVIGYAFEFVLRVIAFTLRLIGNAFYYLGSILISVYDIVAFPAMLIDSIGGGGVRAPKTKKSKASKKAAKEEVLDLEEE